MSSVTDLRAAIAAALKAGLDGTIGAVSVYGWPAPAPNLPAAVVGDDDPLIAQHDDEDAGYGLRVIRLRVLLMVSDIGEPGYAQLETWADQMDALMAAVVPPTGMTRPAVTSVSARGLVPYAEITALGQFFDLEVSDRFC